ncbi:MAG: hypothetical protein DI630_16520 [Gordonia sp. (in: high G+C Gram-positive bacteria)]|nr:MAG: hypothetical protein DI630_16520 [Gordonia sp. (in: high G+C Gram-positive bacteria)]
MTIASLNTVTGLLIGVDGTTSRQHLHRTEGSVLADLQAIIGADEVEALALRDCPHQPGRTVDVWTATGGGLQPNWVATALAALVSDDHSRVLYGPVVLLTSDQRTGRCHALPAALVDGIGTAAARLGEASTIAGKVEQSLRA